MYERSSGRRRRSEQYAYTHNGCRSVVKRSTFLSMSWKKEEKEGD
jgi:hypothetical protein